MAEISMRRSHSFGEAVVRERIEELAEKVCARFGGTWHWHGNEAVCEARGVKARVGYDALTIQIDVWLPTMMRPLRGKLQTKLEESFERMLDKG